MTVKKFQIKYLEQAEKDILDIYYYIAEHDSIDAAEAFLHKIEIFIGKLDSFPHRGNHLKEFKHLGESKYKEINKKPYRVIYEVIKHNVFIHAVLDGRRDLEGYLFNRLISA